VLSPPVNTMSPAGCHRRFSPAWPASTEPGTQKGGSEGAIPERGKGRNTPGLTLLYLSTDILVRLPCIRDSNCSNSPPHKSHNLQTYKAVSVLFPFCTSTFPFSLGSPPSSCLFFQHNYSSCLSFVLHSLVLVCLARLDHHHSYSFM
jgi:hypothetical protein